ncbi:MAG: glycerol-3-phosphate 1-O-acyltransferase PlsY [Sumerlaeia bacterium]
MLFHPILGLLLAYFIGAIPTGLLIGKWFRGIDLRDHGSKNIGFTNALRVMGPKFGIPVLIIDLGKALGATLAIPAFCPADLHPAFPALVGACVIFGNLANVFLKFKGGKGVATAAGVFLALSPVALGIALAAFLIVLAVSRYVSLGSICAAIALPASIALTLGFTATFWVAVVIGGAVIVKHRGNIARLVSGEENKIGGKKKAAASVEEPAP